MHRVNLKAAAIGMVAGHFLYQAFGPGDYLEATERAFFTVGALFAVWVIGRINREQQ